jgi:hypothetical protein
MIILIVFIFFNLNDFILKYYFLRFTEIYIYFALFVFFFVINFTKIFFLNNINLILFDWLIIILIVIIIT